MSNLTVNLRTNRKMQAASLAFALLIMGCTGGAPDGVDESQAPADEATTSQPDNGEETELGQEPDFPVSPSGTDEVQDDELVFADEVALSEDVADSPEPIPEAEVEVDLELTPEVPQADLEVSESAICATVQIGRDAVVDGDEVLVGEQRDLLAERLSSVSDSELSEILADAVSDNSLDPDQISKALDRCTELGFER